MSKKMGVFFGLSRREFTDAELKTVAVAVAKSLSEKESSMKIPREVKEFPNVGNHVGDLDADI